MSKLELLAPAGNKLKMETAFAYGADAVYLGIPDFSLRVRINDFDLKSLGEAVKEAHELGKKVYVTVNIFAHNRHLAKLKAYLQRLKSFKVDALIVSDPGIIMLVQEIWPQAEIHLSTQANCTNLAAVKFWGKQGIKRIILGREVSLKDIFEIHQAIPDIELEYFVHGAMCMAYSGRCFLSKLMTNRSANLGDCAQPCRWPYDVQVAHLKTGTHQEELELVEEQHGSYLLNSKDLCLVQYLPQLIAAGVTSFKIEGRAKSVYYQANVVGIYRRALKLARRKVPAAKLRTELNKLHLELETKLINRGYTDGFLNGGRGEQNSDSAHQASAWEFCGQVIKPGSELKPESALADFPKGQQALYFKVHNTIRVGEEIEIIRPDYDIIKLKPVSLWDAKTGAMILEAHGGGGGTVAVLAIKTKQTLPVFTVLRRYRPSAANSK